MVEYITNLENTIENKKLGNVFFFFGLLSFYTATQLAKPPVHLALFLSGAVIGFMATYIILKIYSYFILLSGMLLTGKKLNVFSLLKYTYIAYTPLLSAAFISRITGNWLFAVFFIFSSILQIYLLLRGIKTKYETGYLKAFLIFITPWLIFLCLFLFLFLAVFLLK